MKKRFWILLAGLAGSAGLLGPAAAAPGWQAAPMAGPAAAASGWAPAPAVAPPVWRFRPLGARAGRDHHRAAGVRGAAGRLSGWRFRPLERRIRAAGPAVPPGIRPARLAPRPPMSARLPRFAGARAMALRPPLPWAWPGAGRGFAYPFVRGPGSAPVAFRGPDRRPVRPLMARAFAPPALARADAPAGPTWFHGYRFRPWSAPLSAPRAPVGVSGWPAKRRPPALLAAPAGPWPASPPRLRSAVAALPRPVSRVREGLRPPPPTGSAIGRIGETPLLRTPWMSRPHTPGVYRFRPARSWAGPLTVRVPADGRRPAAQDRAARQGQPKPPVPALGMGRQGPAGPARRHVRTTAPAPALQAPAMRARRLAAPGDAPARAAPQPEAPPPAAARDRLHGQAVQAPAPPPALAPGLRSAGPGTGRLVWRLPDGRVLHPAAEPGVTGT